MTHQCNRDEETGGQLLGYSNDHKLCPGTARLKCKTLPKALRTQALTALTSNFGLVGLVQYA